MGGCALCVTPEKRPLTRWTEWYVRVCHPFGLQPDRPDFDYFHLTRETGLKKTGELDIIRT